MRNASFHGKIRILAETGAFHPLPEPIPGKTMKRITQKGTARMDSPLFHGREEDQKNVTVFFSMAERSWFARRLTPKRNRSLFSQSLPSRVLTME